MCHELQNNADLYLLYNKDTQNIEFWMHKQKRDSFTQAHQSSIAPTINLSPATSVLVENPRV